jgi:hypothetical protein
MIQLTPGPMTRPLFLLIAVPALLVAGTLRANIVIEPTFDEKMELSELVVIGTVESVDRAGRDGSRSTATLSVVRTLKGEAAKTIIVRTHHPIEELDTHCCEVGATYIMFLRHSAGDGQLISIRGVYGMVRVAGPKSEYRVIRR